MAGIILKPYVMPKQNPVLAGRKQKNIAEKAAMGADDTAVNHYNIEIQTKTPAGRWKSKWSYHINIG